jgi:single-strand DNA-binding protein
MIVLGRVGRDVELRYTQAGTAVANVSVATSRSWKDKTTGERAEETQWHAISFFDRLAEIAGEFLRKGSLVYVEGRLKTRQYTDKDGVQRSVTEIVAEQMQLVGGRPETAGGGGRADGGEDQGTSQPPQRSASASQGQAASRSGAPASASQRAPAPAPQGGRSTARHEPAHAGFDDFDDQIPFVRSEATAALSAEVGCLVSGAVQRSRHSR